MSALEKLLRDKLRSWTSGPARVYRQRRDERTASKPPTPTTFGFKFSGPRPISSYETDEINIFLDYLQTSSACIDIGANVGLYTCLAASQSKPVIAIEPNGVNLQRLYRNLLANEFLNVEVYPVGLSSAPRIQRLYGSGLNASLIAGWAKATEGHFSLVPLTTLDILAGARFEGLPITIKMDVEGFELEVLQGARRTLARNPKPFWLVEIVLTEQVPGGINSRIYDTFDLFWDQGYEARTADRDRRLIRPQDVKRWVATGSRDFGSYNYSFSSP